MNPFMRRMSGLKLETLFKKAAANKMWGAIDQQVMADAPVAVVFTPKQLDFISSGSKNYLFSLQYKMFVDQLQVK